MDLYIQVGVILLFLAALSLFVYFYTQPAQQFTEGINDTTKELNQRLETASGVNLNQYLLNTNVSGAQVKKLIQDAEASKIGVLVQTKAQKGLLVNYGYQLRNENLDTHVISPNGRAGASSTEFEKSFVSAMNAIYTSGFFANNYPDGAKKDFALGYGQSYAGHATFSALMNSTKELSESETSDAYSHTQWKYYMPLITSANASVETYKESFINGNYSEATGLLYSPNKVRLDFPVNVSISKSKNVVYYIDDVAKFNTTLIKGITGEIIGVYVEEQGVPQVGGVMLDLLASFK